VAWRQTEIRQRQRLDAGRKATGIVGETDEAVRPRQVACNAGAQVVDVFGAVQAPPLHADDVDRRGHS
jgi:hypothetical protein